MNRDGALQYQNVEILAMRKTNQPSSKKKEREKKQATTRILISSRSVWPLSSACRCAVSTEITMSPNCSCKSKIKHVKEKVK